MADRVFDEIITQGVRSGQIPARTNAAREWYRDAARNFGAKVRQGGKEAGRIDYARMSENKLIKNNQDRLTNTIMPGSMYMYHYNAKYKDELPFWDRFPLVFPFRVESDRFWGLNLHYLPLNHRAILMDALYGLANNKRYDESTRLKLNYQALNQAAKFRYFKPCVKQYLKSQLESKFVYIYPSEWDIALFLPLERFQKATKAQVYSNSKSIIQGN